MSRRPVLWLAGFALTATLGCRNIPEAPQVKRLTRLTATSHKEAPLGHLKWKVVEVSTGNVLASGDRAIHLSDAVVFTGGTEGRSVYNPAISLGNHFYLARPEQTDATSGAVSGFGMTLEKDDSDAFSWEWFNVDSPTHAAKLQEGGELRIEIGKYGDGYAIRRTEFLTNISMRASLLVKDNPGKERWRAEISKGSTILGPTVEHGHVVSK